MSFQTAEQAVFESVKAIFERWTALILTVEHQLGGDPRPVRRILQTTVTLATSTSPKYNARHIADYLHEEFDRMQTDIEDGSPEEVAEKIVNIRNAAALGDFSAATELVKQTAAANVSNTVSQSVQGIRGQDDQGNEDDTMNDDETQPTPKPQTVVDEDGFTSVVRGGRHR